MRSWIFILLVLVPCGQADETWQMRRAGLATLGDQDRLLQIAEADPVAALREAATSLLRRDEDLVDRAVNDLEWHVRRAAIETLQGRSALGEIARRSRSWRTRALAIRSLVDDDARLRLAEDPSFPLDLRRLALEEISNASAEKARLVELLEIGDLRATVAPHLGAQHVVSAILDIGVEDRISLIEKIVDEVILEALACSDPDETIRAAAVTRLRSVEVATQLAENDESTLVRASAIESLRGTGRAMEWLVDPDPRARAAALKASVDLWAARFALSDSAAVVRIAAIDFLAERRYLDLGLADPDASVRSSALSALPPGGGVVATARTAEPWWLRWQALRRIDDHEELHRALESELDQPLQSLVELRLGRRTGKSSEADVILFVESELRSSIDQELQSCLGSLEFQVFVGHSEYPYRQLSGHDPTLYLGRREEIEVVVLDSSGQTVSRQRWRGSSIGKLVDPKEVAEAVDGEAIAIIWRPAPIELEVVAADLLDASSRRGCKEKEPEAAWLRAAWERVSIR